MVSMENSIKCLKNINIIYNVFQKIEEETLYTLIYKISITFTMIPNAPKKVKDYRITHEYRQNKIPYPKSSK